MSFAARHPRLSFGAQCAAWLLIFLVIGWQASPALLDALRPLAEGFLRVLGLATRIIVLPSHDWLVTTGLVRATGMEIGDVNLLMRSEDLRHQIFGLPLFLALILAPPRDRPWRGLGLGLVCFVLGFCIALAGFVLCRDGVIINHQPALLVPGLAPPPFEVTAPEIPGPLFILSGLGAYLPALIPPVLPIALWLALNRRLGELRGEPL